MTSNPPPGYPPPYPGQPGYPATAVDGQPGAVDGGPTDTGPTDTGPIDGGTPWRRLNRRMLFILPVQEIPRTFPVLIAALLAGRSSHGQYWGLVGVVVVIGASFLRYLTTTFRITPDQIQIRKGLLRRNLISVPRDRVRTVDLSAPIVHRLLGLVRVVIGTGQSDRRKEGLRLDSLTAVEADALRDELLHRRPAPATTTDPTATADPTAGPTIQAPPMVSMPDPTITLTALRPAWIGYGPFTLSGLVTAGVVVGFAWRGFNESRVDPAKFGPLQAIINHLRGLPLATAVIEVILAGVLVIALLSTIGYVMAFWGFRLGRHPGGTLHISRGLLTTRATTIEERRLRGVELSETLLLRVVRGARLIAIATGLRVGRGAERGGTVLLPPAPRAEAYRVAGLVLNDPDVLSLPLVRHGARAAVRRYNRALLGAAILIGVVALLCWVASWGYLPVAWSLLVVPPALLLAADRYRSLGHTVTHGFLVTRLGSLIRRRSTVSCQGIIGWRIHQSFFQRRTGLATLVATTAAGKQAYEIQDLDLAAAVRVADSAIPDLLTPFLVRRSGTPETA